MRHNTITDNNLTLFCLVDGQSASKAFLVEPTPKNTVHHLKVLISAFLRVDVLSIDLTLWRVSIPVIEDDDELPILLSNVAAEDKKKLFPTSRLSKVIPRRPPEDTVHILIQLSSKATSSTSSSDSTSSDDLLVDLEVIMDKFFTPESDVANFLDRFVLGLENLPLTTGNVSGLPRIWLRNKGRLADTQPSLLFSGLPDPSSNDTHTQYPTSDAIIQLIERCSTSIVPVFGVSGCGKTRGMIELLSRRWGFYFNASGNDLGSDDVTTLISYIGSRLEQDREANNRRARIITYLLLLSRLKVLQYCLTIPGSCNTFTSARWTILQTCAHVFNNDIFGKLLRKLLKLFPRCPTPLIETDLERATQKEFEVTREKPDRPLLSPILWGFRNISVDYLTLITSGTGLSIYTLGWAQSSGSFNKPTRSLTGNLEGFEYMEFPSWTGRASIEAYVAELRGLLPTDGAKQALDSLLGPKAFEAISKRLIGRFRPAVTAIERIVASGEPGDWKDAVDVTEARLVSYDHCGEQGNLCNEIVRLENKYRENLSIFKELRTVEEVLGLLLFQRYMFGADKLVLQEAVPELVERAFGRIKIIDGVARTVLDEPFVLKAAENYFEMRDSGFMETTEWWIRQSDRPQAHGYAWELMIMNVFIETFKTRSLSDWPHEPSILSQCTKLAGFAVIVGLDEQGLQRGISHEHISMEDFLNAHVHNGSMHDGRAIPPFFFPKAKPSGPDIVFYIRVNRNLFPVFAQLKLRQTMAKPAVQAALMTVSAPAIETHVEDLESFCPTSHTYISMIIAYPASVVDKLRPRPDPVYNLRSRSDSKHNHKRLTQVTVIIDKSNISKIFPQSHVDFLNGVKDPMKREAQLKSITSHAHPVSYTNTNLFFSQDSGLKTHNSTQQQDPQFSPHPLAYSKMIFKPVHLLLAAIFASQVSARFCLNAADVVCDVTWCDFEYVGVRNGESLDSIHFMVPIGLPSDQWYCGDEWRYNPKRHRVRACGQEGEVTGSENDRCADIC
ncbi:MAG: hypothetical protein J3R72DRAFT_493794 [Linnemannia gamsii]|nr:MAG: hypothetical protein J3R72DRAFT_493794 [Linnemannia gamsii]